LAAIFQSITPRTAGFNTVNMSALRSSTWILMIVLMFIGASPGSTGGGVKTSTIGVIFATVLAAIRGDAVTVIFRRRISAELVRRSLAIVTLASLLLLVTTMLLTFTEKFSPVQLLFEATSAFGTVGLTTGITTKVSDIGRVLLIALMYTGRVGPLTLAAAIAARQKQHRTRLAEGRVLVG
jgi:trk system potassium uptake protein TrkH